MMAESKRPDLRPETLAEANSRIWDLALNLVHPAGIYVLLQLVIHDHMGKTPPLVGRGPLEGLSLLLYVFQFLGAWTVLYTTLLRDMGYRSSWGTILLIGSVVGVVMQYVLFPDPWDAGPAAVRIFLWVNMCLAGLGWTLTAVLWRRLKRAYRSDRADADGGEP
jgi:hypothetical protein